MNRIDFSNLGGLPVTQNTLDFLQHSYMAALSGVAKLCGNKTILAGVESSGGNVSAGWISYNNELIPFIGGPLGAQVVITETPQVLTFQDGNEHDVYFTRTATCGAVGDFPFSDLVPLLSLQNIWRPGDIKERYCDGAYIAANFDTDGYGLNAEKGWRIFSKVVPASAGKVFVNQDTDDADFYAVGNTGGEKKHQLTISEMPKHKASIPLQKRSASGSDGTDSVLSSTPTGKPVTFQSSEMGGDVAHNNLQPYFVILKLIKL